MYCVESHQVVIVVGQTGCGKTTRTSHSRVLHVPLVTTINHFQKSHNTCTKADGPPEAG
jgi:ABC-type lipoprotein export system ATPase subunit